MGSSGAEHGNVKTVNGQGANGVGEVTLDFADLPDVDVAGVSNGQIPIYNSASHKFVAGSAGSASALDDLTDVDTTGEATGDALMFDGAKWTPAAPASALDELTDVDTTGETSGDSLVYDGTSWKPKTLAAADVSALTDTAALDDLADADTTGETPGDSLVYDGTSWKPKTLAATDTGAIPKTTGETSGDSLVYDGTDWSPKTLTATDIAGAFVVVDQGTNAATLRPAGALAVYWIGTADPTNKVAGDLVLGTA